MLIIDIILCYAQEKETKKETFRKYLESSGVLDALTKGFLPIVVDGML